MKPISFISKKLFLPEKNNKIKLDLSSIGLAPPCGCYLSSDLGCSDPKIVGPYEAFFAKEHVGKFWQHSLAALVLD